jgi:Na+/H+ antiporter NhaD/arsenite permease-like protein
MVIFTAISGFLLLKNNLTVGNESATVVLKSILMLYMLIIIPFAFKYFSVQVKKIADTKNEKEKFAKYLKICNIRLWMIGSVVIAGVLAYFIFYELKRFDMLYFAGIGAIALLFCIPTKMKIENDLNF